MDFIKLVMPVLWQILEKKKRCSINVATVDNELTINILTGTKRRTFKNKDGSIIFRELSRYLHAI